MVVCTQLVFAFFFLFCMRILQIENSIIIVSGGNIHHTNVVM